MDKVRVAGQSAIDPERLFGQFRFAPMVAVE